MFNEMECDYKIWRFAVAGYGANNWLRDVCFQDGC